MPPSTRFSPTASRTAVLLLLLLALGPAVTARAVIRDGGIDPENLGKGDWIVAMSDATNRLGGHVSSVTNENSLMLFYKSIGVRYIIIKAATSNYLFKGCYSFPQFNSNVVNAAHAHGILCFGYNRSYGGDIPGEIAISDYVFGEGADGFVWDAEAEWETGTSHPWITNGSAQAWALCGAVRTNWPNKFLAHAPFPIIYLHSSFPYKEFGYWCDAVMPQIYFFGWSGVKGSPSGGVNWSDVNWRTWQSSLVGASSVINGQTIYWTNSIKPLAPVNNVYGEIISGGSPCYGNNITPMPDKNVMEFLDYLSCDLSCVTVGGYQGASLYRADLHGVGQFANISAATSGAFPGQVNNIVIDDPSAARSGPWTSVLTYSATTTAGSFTGNGSGTDTNSFGTNYLACGQGSGSGYVQFTPNIIEPGDYRVYQWHPLRTDASASVPFVISYNGGSTTVYANQQTNAGNWSLLGQFNFAAGTAANVRVTDGIAEPGAVGLADGVKLVFVYPTTVPATPTGLNATATSSNQIALTWTDNATNETAYFVGRSSTAGGPYSTIAALPMNSTGYLNGGLSPSSTCYYVVWATNLLGASATADEASATTPGGPIPPDITSQPQGQTAVLGETALFGVTATGTEPLAYQWRLNGSDIGGATDSTYTLPHVQPGDAGTYSVLVTNTAGSVLSSNAALVVDTDVTLPIITAQPQSQTIIAGQSVTFTVSATNKASLSYQWRLNGAPISGATHSAYTRSNVQLADAGSYSVVITNIIGSTNSADAVLTVNFSLTATATPGGTVTKDPDLSSYQPDAVVTLTAEPAGGYTFVGWSGDAGGTNNPLAVTLSANKAITANFASLASDIVLDNTNAETTFVGEWQTGTSSTDKFGPDYRFASTAAGGLSNAIFRPYILTPGYYDVSIWYPQGSNRATNAPWSVVYDGGSVNVSVNQQANGGQWLKIAAALPFAQGTGGYAQLSNDTGYSGKVVMADAARFTLVTNFTLTASAATGGAVYADPNQTNFTPGAAVTLVAAPVFGWSFSGWSGSAGGTANPLTITMTTNMSVTANFTPAVAELIVDNPAATSTGTWTTRTTGSGYYGANYMTAATDSSATATATYTPSIVVPGNYDVYIIYPGSGTPSTVTPYLLVYNGGSVSFTVNQQLNQGQWQLVSSARNFAAGSSGYLRLSNDTGESSRRVIADAVRWIFSAAQDSPPVIVAQPQSQTAAVGGTVTFSAWAAGTEALHYQWRFNGADINGANGSSYTRNRVQVGDAGSYSVLVTNAAGSILSSNALLAVNVPPEITTHPQSLGVTAGSNVTFTVAATGTEPLSYQWRFNGADLAYANASAYTCWNAQADDAGSYSVLVSNMAGTALSQEAILTVAEPTPPRIDAITEGPDGLIQLQVSGVPGHYAIDASSNLAGWMELTNFTTTAGSFQYVDAETNLLQRFYRVRLLP